MNAKIRLPKVNIKTIFLFLSLILWLKSNYIADCFFPGDTTQDVNNYWDLKKIIYSICILLIILSAEYKERLKKFIALIFIGIISEDISDRLQNITYFQWSDIIVLELVVLSSAYIIYRDDINNKVFNSNFFSSFRR